MIPPSKRLIATVAWGLSQILLLAIGASGFPIWAHPPLPHESLAFLEMICGQTLISSLFPPLFATDAISLSMLAMIMLPMDELASLLANTSQLAVLEGFSCVMLWIVGLAGCCRLLGNSRYLPVVGAGATLFTAGGAVLDYLQAEARAGGAPRSSWIPVSPLPNLCLFIEHGAMLASMEMAAPLLLFLLATVALNLFPKPRS